MTGDEAKKWTWFREAGLEALRTTEPKLKQLLDLIEEEDRLLSNLLDRETSWASERPQDYVSCVLSARAFRLTVSAIFISLSGYPDTAPNLIRSIWEISVRLLDLCDNPVSGALGYLLKGSTDEIRMMETELKHFLDTKANIGQLETNLQTCKDDRTKLRATASSHGLDPDLIEKRHGKMNVKKICARNGIEKSYKVDYTFGSLFAHSHHASMDGLIQNYENARLFILGPNTEETGGMVSDAISYMALVLDIAARIVGDTLLVKRTENLSSKICKGLMANRV